MRRRDVLRGTGVAVGAVGLASAAEGARGEASSAEPYAPLGGVAIDGAAEAVVGDDGTTAYVAADSGFATVDVSDPADPTLLADRRGLLADTEAGAMGTIHDVAVDGDVLLVAGPAQPGTAGSKGVLVYDVADPADPVRRAFYPTDHYVHNCYLDGETAYVTGGSYGHRVLIVDVADEDPTTLADWSPVDHEPALEEVPHASLTVHDVYVDDGRAYLPSWDAGTYVLDVSDPGEPTYVTMVGDYATEELADLSRIDALVPPGNHHYARPSEDGSLLAVGRESWNHDSVEGGPGGITLYDLDGAGAPTAVGTIEPERASDETYGSGTWTTAHNFELVGDRLYTAWYQGGVKLYDVGDPAAPEQLAWWRQPAEAAFWTARRAATDAFVASAHAVPSQSDPFEGLYTFPDRPGEQADPPTIGTPTPSGTPTTDAGTPTATDAPTAATPSPTDAPSPTPTPSSTAGSTDAQTENRASGDGFGLLAGLAALGGAAWWRRRD